MTTEQRRFARLPMRPTVHYTIVDTQQLGTSIAADLSAGGIRLVAEHPFRVGASLKLVIQLPDQHEPIRCLGEVLWSKPAAAGSGHQPDGGATEVGVKFVAIAPKDQVVITRYALFYR